MKIGVIGAGGVGGTFGAALHRAGNDVRFLARGRHLAAIRDRGLRIDGVRGPYTVTGARVSDRPGELGTVDVALLTVKMWDLGRAVRSMSPMLSPDTVLITVQNGIDAPWKVAAVVGEARVAAGSCFMNAEIAGPGMINQRSKNQRLVVSMLNGGPSPMLERFALTCHDADIEFELKSEPLEVLWEKFVQVVATSATTALLRRPIGTVRDDADSWNLLLNVMRETARVGRANGVKISPETVERRIAYVKTLPPDATASMATDLIHGRRLELRWLSGRVCELGRRYGIPTPANDFVQVALKPFELGAELSAA
jgi:2-dehydropantoate 2-reductase